MRNNFSTLYSFMLIVGDFVALLASFVIAYIFRVSIDHRPIANQISAVEFIKIFILLLPILLVIFACLQLYLKQVYERRVSEFGRLLVGSFIGILVLIGYDFVSPRAIFPAKLVALYAFILGFLLLLLERSLLRWLRRQLFGYGIGISRVMIVGSGRAANSLVKQISDTRHTGQKVVATMGSPTELIKKLGIPVLANLKNIDKLAIDTIIQAGSPLDESVAKEIFSYAQQRHIAYKFVPEQAELYAGNARVELYQGLPVVMIQPTALVGWGRVIKRLFDLMVSLVALVILSPLMVLIAVLIKLTDPQGPVLFKQDRLTRFDAKFKVLKFRSMIQRYSGNGKNEVEIFKSMGREDLAEEFARNRGKVTNDPRITKVGKFLRATSLDELPQLINVLKGDISLVGPRAIVEKHAEEYQENRSLMLSVKTGITGLAQVSGRDDLTLDERVRLDVYYVQNWSFWMDIGILVRTVYILLVRRGFKS